MTDKNYSPYLGGIQINESKQPVIVFTVGKVGSKTIVESLYALDKIPYSIYHAHVLSNEIDQFTNKEGSERNFQSTNQYLRFNKELSVYIRENFYKHNWKVITLIREPLGIILSSFFEFLDIGKTLQDRYPELFKGETLNISFNEFQEFYSTKFSYMTGDYVVNWFDLELKKVFGIDVYEYQFDKTKGYTIAKRGNVELLVIRLENLNKVFHNSIREFLGIEKIEMVKENIGENRHFSNYMNFLKSNLKVKKHVCDHFYSSKFATHFYTPMELSSFSAQWTLRDTNEKIQFDKYGVIEENVFHGLNLWEKPLVNTPSIDSQK